MKRFYFLLLAALSTSIYSDSSNDQDGSLNTNTVDSTVSSNNVNEDKSVSNTYNGSGSSSEIPVGSAIAPSYMSNGLETCLVGTSGSFQTAVIGVSRGKYKSDQECNRRRDSKMLADLGMKVAAIGRLCQNNQVWRSMLVSGTPCPILKNGRLIVGKKAFLVMKMQPETYIPDYNKSTQDWYNTILNIGEESSEEQSEDIISVTNKFRSSVKPDR